MKYSTFTRLLVFSISFAFYSSSLSGQASITSYTTLPTPIEVTTFPYYEENFDSDAVASGTPIGMQGTCNALPCCSGVWYKMTIDSQGSLFSAFDNFSPLSTGLIWYKAESENITTTDQLTYISGIPNNFCGFAGMTSPSYGYQWRLKYDPNYDVTGIDEDDIQEAYSAWVSSALNNPFPSDLNEYPNDGYRTDITLESGKHYLEPGTYWLYAWNTNQQVNFNGPDREGAFNLVIDFAEYEPCPEGFTCESMTETICSVESYTTAGEQVITETSSVEETIGTVITTYNITVDESITCCPDGYTCNVVDVTECANSIYTSPFGNTISEDGSVLDENTETQNRTVYNVTFDRAEVTADIYQDALIATSGSVTYQANTNATGVLSFDKTQDYWVNMNALQDDLDGTNRSVFMWIKSEANVATDNQVLFAINTASGGNVTLFWIDISGDNLEIYDSQDAQSASYNMSDQLWHYVGYTYNTTTHETVTYVDGIENDRFTDSQITDSNSQYSLGQEFDNATESNYFNGDMAEISLWNEVLTGAEIREAMMAKINTGHPKFTNLVGYYSVFGDCDDDTSVLKDHSGKGNDGVMMNGFTQDFKNVQTVTGFNAIDWYENLSWKQNGTEVATTNTYTTGVAAGNYDFTATRNFIKSSDTWSMTVNSNATTIDNIADETLCEDDPITRTVATNTVNYLDFEETENNYIELNSLSDDLVAKNRSVFMWINKESNIGSGDFNAIFGLQAPDIANVSNFYLRETEKLALFDGTNRINSSTVLGNDTWYHVGYTYDNSTGEAKIFVNGEEEDSGTLNISVSEGWLAILGAQYNSNGPVNYLDGKLAEITIWDKVLTQEEVTSLMGAAPAHNNEHLVAAYGTLPSIADNQLRDLTANGNDGSASHNSIIITTEEAEITDYDASANYSISWKNGGTEFDTDATGNISVEEGTTNYSVTYGNPLFQKTDEFSLSYTNLIPVQPMDKTAGALGRVTFEVNEIPGASYQWYEKKDEKELMELNELNSFGTGVFGRGNDIYISDKKILVGTGNGFFLSTNLGRTWNKFDLTTTGFSTSSYVLNVFARGDKLFVGTIEGLSISDNGGETWSTILAGTRVERIFEHEESIYVVADKVYKSTDGGNSWNTFISTISQGGVNSSPSNIFIKGSTLFASKNQGLLKSVNGGSSWSNISLNPSDSYPRHTIVGDDNYIFYSFNNSQDLARSSDDGATWEVVFEKSNSDFNGDYIENIKIKNGELYISYLTSILKSSDYGDTWETLFDFGSPTAFGGFDFSNDDLYIATHRNNISVFSDKVGLENTESGLNQIQGATTHQLSIDNLSLDENGTEYFVVVTKDDCSQTSDDVILTVLNVPIATSYTPANGNTDIAIDTQLSIEFNKSVSKGTGNLKIFNYATDALVQTFAADDLTIDGTSVSIASGVSLDYSTQYYITFGADLVKDGSNAGNLPLTDKNIYTFSTLCAPLILNEPTDQTALAARSATFTVPEVSGASYQWFQSFDGTVTSLNGLVNNTQSILEIEGTTYFATPNGLYISEDEGQTFTHKTVSDGLGSNDCEGLFYENGVIYVATRGGLSISTDGGNSFINRTTSDGLVNNETLGVYSQGQTVYVAGIGGLSMSSDGGLTFTDRTAQGITSNCTSVFADGDNIYVTSYGGLFMSEDNGQTFIKKNSSDGLASTVCFDVKLIDDVIYVGTISGFSISYDGGSSFVNKSTEDGLLDNWVTDLSYSNGLLYVGTNKGLVVSSDYGNSFTSISEKPIVDVYASPGQVYFSGGQGSGLQKSYSKLKVTNVGDNQIQGVSERELTISDLTTELDQSKYYVVVTKGECEDTSDVATLTVTEASESISYSTLSPANDESGVSLTPSVSLTLNEAVQKGTGTIELRRSSDDQVVTSIGANSSQVTIANNVASIALGDVSLDPATSYYFVVPTTAFTDGNSKEFVGIADKTSWAFTTEYEALIISATFPSSTRDALLDFPYLNIEFSEQIAIGSGQITIYRAADNSVFETLDISTANVKNSGTPLQAQLALSQNWEVGVSYYIQYPQGLITSLDGTKQIEAITNNTSFAFKAESFNENIITGFFPATGSTTYEADSEDDMVIYTSVGVGLERDPLGSFRIYKASNDELVKTIEYDGENDRDLDYGDDDNYIKFEFDDDELEPGTEYYVLVDDGFIIDYEDGLFHVGISDPTTWRFTTLEAPTTPAFVSSSPANGATNVLVSANIQLTYSENIQAYVYGEAGTATNNIILYDANDNEVERFAANSDRLTYSGSKVIINPTNDLSYNTTYYMLVEDEAFVSNNEIETEEIFDTGIIRFTTGGMPNTAPTVTSLGIAGTLEANQELIGSYTYNDADTDSESGSTLQWFTADDASGANRTAISGATSSTFTLTSSEIGKYITFGVTPNDGADAGTEAFAVYDGPIVAAVIPTVVSTVPADGAINVVKDTDLSFVLSESVIKGTGNIILTPVTGSAITIDVTSNEVVVSGTDITINPNSDLIIGQFYTITFDASAFVDADGNSSSGLTNQTIWNFTVKEANVAPEAQGVSIKKSLVVDGELEGSYTYFDQNDDSESGTTFQWYRADDAAGTGRVAINGATSQNYTVVNDDNGKFVSFGVTPNDGALAGTAKESAFFGSIRINDGFTNIPPAFTSDALTSILDNETYSYTVTYEDLNNDVPTLTKQAGPSWLTVNGMVISGNPSSADVGDHNIILELVDQYDDKTYQEFTLTVVASNTAPSVNSVIADIILSLQIGAPINGAYNFIDAESDADNSTYKWYRADDASGTNKTEISGATSKAYTLSSADAGKYISFEVTPNDGTVNGTLAESVAVGPVIKKTPSLSLSTIAKTYGDADINLAATTNSSGAITYSFDNDQTGAAINGSTVTLGNIGEITVNVNLAEDAEFKSRQVQGTITIAKKAIELTATNANKLVGDTDPNLEYTVTSGAIVGNDEVVNVSRDAGEAPGTYAITFTDGADAGNYEVTTNDGAFTISQRALTITAEAANKTYGDADPIFNYSITAGTLQSGDQLSGAVTRIAGENVGTYALKSSLFNASYDITFVPADLTITKRDLNATADNKIKFLGQANPELTVSYSGFANGDNKSAITEPTIAATADETSAIGNYDITLTGGSADNYNLTLVNGILTVKQNPFITTWEIRSNDVNRSRTFFNTVGNHTYQYDIDWGDGTVETNQTGPATHTYTAEGTYTVKVSGQFPQFELSFSRLRSVEQWGDIEWESMERAFVAADFEINATDAPDLSRVSSMKLMFERSYIGNPDLTSWDVSTITNMSELFQESDFNGDISNWDVSSVTDMSYMFAQTENFNSDISNWNTSAIQNMSYMFYSAEAFDQSIGTWDVSGTTDMSSMFADASIFNQDLNAWNVGNVSTMEKMFDNAELFNGNIAGWNVSNVTDMSNMFDDAKAFNQNIDGWDVSNVTEMNAMFNDADAFNQSLNSWNVSKVQTFQAMFQNNDAFNAEISNWDISNATKLERMFEDAHAFNQDISNWQPTNADNLTAMFRDARSFNQDISSWRFPNADKLNQMFYEAAAFNQDISEWETSNIVDMSSMFENAEAFDQAIGAWEVSSVTRFGSMFRGTLAFNQDLSEWDMSAATALNSMFKNAAAFNQDISGWTFGEGLTSLSSMFENASVFDQNLGNWDISNIESLSNIFSNSGMSIANYDATLIGWAAQEVQDDLEFGVEGLQYCAGTAARQSLIDEHNWTIENDIQGCSATVTIADISAKEDDGAITVTITSDAFVVGGFTVDVSTTDGTATAGTDYTAIASQTITFAGTVGETQTFTISPTLDTDVEDNETLTVSMSNLVTNGVNSVTITDQATVTIIDDDRPVVSFAIISSDNDEATASANIEVALNQAGLASSSVDYTISGTATGNGVDYTLANGTLTFAAGDLTKNITIAGIVDDEIVEENETVIITLSNPTGVVLGTNTIHTYTITDNDAAKVTWSSVTSGEGDGPITLTATLDKAVVGGFTVDLITAESSAIKEVDYTGLEGVTLTFTGTAGETQSTLITPIDDDIVEPKEEISVLFDNLSGTTLPVTFDDVILINIEDNDQATVTIANVAQFEDGESFRVTATLDKAVVGGFKVKVSSLDGTATLSDNDYEALDQTLTFAGTAGETQAFDVSASYDQKLEANETFTVQMTGLTGTTLPVDITDQATLTITNDDEAAVTIADVSGNEGDGAITVSAVLNNAVQGGFSVEVATTDGTATAVSDYTAITSQVLTFAGTAGEIQTFIIVPSNDLVIEADETLTVAMANLSTSLAVVITDVATITIVNDDFNNFPTELSLSATSIAENNALTATVGILSTTDADAGDNHTYSLVAGTGDTDNASFTVDGSSLKVNNTSFNFEMKTSYEIRLKTDDAKGGVLEKAFVITVTNVNEAPLTLSLTNATIEESDDAQTVGSFMSLDPDNGDTFSYSLSSGTGDTHNSEFAISGSTLSTAGAIDFEDGETRSIRVQVTDAGGLTFEQSFNITIEDVVAEPVREYTQNQSGADVKNVFSPNGDGVNETWVIEDLLDNPFNEVRVFAQGGKLIYSKVNYTNDWGGTFKDNPVPDGTYYYEIVIFENAQSTSPARTIKGFLTIIRNR